LTVIGIVSVDVPAVILSKAVCVAVDIGKLARVVFLIALEAEASAISISSLVTGVTLLSLFISTFNVTAPEAPPPDKPSPAVTPVISPAPLKKSVQVLPE
jgi:hypothetical protein